MDTKDTRVGVVVGRFQVDELHDGHMRLLTLVNVTHENMLVLVGVRPAEPSDTNPLNFMDRYTMIREKFPTALVLPIMDKRDDKVWSRQVDSLIDATYGYGTGAVFHVGRDSFQDHYHGKFRVEEHDFGIDDVVAKDIRNEIKDRTLTTAEGRAGAIKAAMNQTHRTTMMVDMFMVRPDGEGDFEILMGKKEGEDLWRLPGGRVDPGESFAHAAAREMFEETGMATSGGVVNWTYIGDFNIEDWRCRDTDRVSYRTVLMTAEYFSGKAEGADDLPEVQWIRRDAFALNEKMVVEEHVHLITAGIIYTMDTQPTNFVVVPEPEKEDA